MNKIKMHKISETTAYLTGRFATEVASKYNADATKSAYIYRNQHDGRHTLVICDHLAKFDDDAYTASDATDDLETLMNTLKAF